MAKSFRFGLTGTTAGSRQAWQNKARKAESLGFSTFLVWDHFDYCLAPMLALQAAADATSTLRVGTFVLANDFRHPAVLAKEVASLDLLSDGRFEFGLGAGWKQREYQQAGIDFVEGAERVARLRESVQLFKQLCQGKAVTFAGQHYQTDELALQPLPLQQPHPPLLIGGARRQMLELAAQEANIVALATRVARDGRHDFVDSTGPKIAEKVAWLRACAGERFAQLELQINVGGVIVTEQRAATLEQLAPTVQLTPEQLGDCMQALVGSEEQIVEDLLQRRERYGISYISVDERFVDALAPIVARLAGT